MFKTCHFEHHQFFGRVLRQAQQLKNAVSEPAELLSRCRFFEITARVLIQSENHIVDSKRFFSIQNIKGDLIKCI
jgi:hypothetical protein